MIFYDHSDDSSCFSNHSQAKTQTKINNNLGWTLGFRSITHENNHLEYIVPKKDAIIADAVCYIPYTKYFIIVIFFLIIYFDSVILILDPYLTSIEYLIYSYDELIDESVSNKN